VPDEVIHHAYNNPIRSEQLDDALTMLIGPDHAGNLYEIGVVDTADGPLVVHVMVARPKYLR
jgi:hypothetical protein